MRILYSHRIQSRDGQSVHVEELVAALRGLGHEVLVVGPGFYDKASFGGESRLVALIRARLPGAIGELAELLYNVPAYLRLRGAQRRFRPDLIYERYNLYHLAGTLLARRTGLPLFLEVNAPLAEERARFGQLGLRRLAGALERFVWRSATRVLAVTDVLKQMIADAGVPPQRIEVVPNGIDPGRFACLPVREAGDGPVVLGFVGFVRDWHGLDQVIASMAGASAERCGASAAGDWSGDNPAAGSAGDAAIAGRADSAAMTAAPAQAGALSGLRLVVVGDGPARAALERQAADLGVADRVRFTGLAGRDAVPALVGGFDIALQPLVVAYASPLKIFEYMAAGRAIVAPDQPNIREILRDGETAVLFDPAEPGAMARAIARLAADPALRQRLGEAARAEIARRDYTWRGNAARVVAWAEASRRTR